MTSTGRDHCAAPDACRARTAAHCRACALKARGGVAVLRWAKPGARARAAEAARAAWADAEKRARTVAGLQAACNAPEVRAALSERARESWADPEIRARRLASITTPALKAAKSATLRKLRAEQLRDARRRALARALVRSAGLPMVRETSTRPTPCCSTGSAPG